MKKAVSMKLLPGVAWAVLAMGAVACQSAPTAMPSAYESAVTSPAPRTSVVGVVRNYDSSSGTIQLDDGTTYVIPASRGGQQMPAGFSGPPVTGQSVRITYVPQGGQRIVTDLEPEPRGDTGERPS